MDKDVVKFFFEVLRLKKLRRSGWGVSGIKNAESIADHSFMTAIMVLVLGRERKIDLDKAVKMAILHDIAESKTGDVISWRNFHKSKEDKKLGESKAMGELMSLLGKNGEEYLKLWNEYEEAKSPEARFVKSVDKVEMVIQALEYDRTEKDTNELFETFFDKNEVEILDKDLSDFMDELVRMRRKK
jgi:putative hydrolases of HD superfamily